MHPPLTHIEVRLLGSLIEKAATTPDTYPLTLSALVAACNQLTNREPVMQLDEEQLTEAIVTLRRRSLLRAIQPAGSRVTKYQHLLHEALDLDARELALMAVLMLRGPQTVGELHTRTARLAHFENSEALELVLDRLVARDSGSLVVRLPKRPGQKEVRYAQLLAGEITDASPEPTAAVPSRTSIGGDLSRPTANELDARIRQLEEELAALRAEFAELKAQLGA